MRRTRLLVPLLLSVSLFSLFVFVKNNKSLTDDLKLQHQPVLNFLQFVALLPVIFLIVRAIDLLAFDVISRRRKVRAPVLLREIVSIILFGILLAWAISAIFGGGKIAAFLATGTVLAAVLGLALQETLGNLFAGIALSLEDAFEVGDVVRTGEILGVVESVRWRGTHLRTFNNNLLIVPNSHLARERLEVFPRNNLNARILQVGVDYNVPPATVISVLTQAATNVDGVSRDVPCFARVGGFGDSAVTYEIKYFTHDYSQRDRIDADIRKALWYAFRRNGISIPYPIRVHQRYAPPEAKAHPEGVEIVERLQNIDILSPLPHEALESIAAAARLHVYSKGETIIRQGAAGDSMFIVHKGRVAVRVGGEEVAQLGEGEFFGEMALLTGEARAADVIALTDVVAVEITKAALQPVLHDYADLAESISAKVMSRRDALDSLRDDAREEAQTSILSRIRSYFGL
ncbi:MAG TPA: mechanosensitive ion channel family protein [Thermoanaerobaculia bacterium]|nr:mechanosensitive ion channel family protein [Thermoanaerobaculia bacterium]